MIQNVPTFDELNRSALNVYFSGWNELMLIISDFDNLFGVRNSDFAAEQEEYTHAMQAELATILTLLAQSNELALKARICRESPYLLLLGTDPKFGNQNTDIDFTELRTIDAVDLPSIVNTLTRCPVSSKYITLFNKIRGLRNKSTHLGDIKDELDPLEIFRLMVEIYNELWSEGNFLEQWYTYISNTRHSYFFDGKWNSAELELVTMINTFYKVLSKGQFFEILGTEKSKRRYVCFRCYYEGGLHYGDIPPSEFFTCHLTSENNLKCMACGNEFPVTRASCLQDDCEGNVKRVSDDKSGYCHTCGSE